MEPGRELFERYLQAVRKYLPWNGQNDILNELHANLEAQIEEREEQLGRSLTEGEMLDWLQLSRRDGAQARCRRWRNRRRQASGLAAMRRWWPKWSSGTSSSGGCC